MAVRWFSAFVVVLFPGLDSAEAVGNFQPPSSEPGQMFVFQNFVYFVATDGIQGRELWRTDVPDGNAELVADLTPGPGDSDLSSFLVVGDRFYFVRSDPVVGGQLWVSDGVPGGRTELVYAFVPDDPRQGAKEIVGALNGQVVVRKGDQATDNAEYWRSDGTASGTRPLRTEYGTELTTDIVSFAEHEGALYLDGVHRGNAAIFRFDGTEAEPTLVRTFERACWGMTSLPGQGLYFATYTEASGSEVWISGGTAATTHLVADIYPGPESSDPGHMTAYIDTDPATPDLLLFSAMHPESGRELWQTDGTEAGTRLVEDLVPGAGSSEPYKIRVSKIAVYLNARMPETGVELWAVRPHSPLPRFNLQADISVGPESSHPYEPCVGLNGDLFFSARDTDGDEELWHSAGYGGKTARVADIMPGLVGSEPYGMVLIRDTVVFAASHPVYGRELWYCVDPARAAPKLLVDLYSDGSVNPSSAPDELTPLGDVMLFVADDLEHGRELWYTDGSREGTGLVADIYPGRTGSNPGQLTRVGNFVYFAAESPDYGTELWGTDGTPEGTAQQLDIYPGERNSSGPKELMAWNGTLLFSAYRAYDGRELWRATPGRKPERVTNLTGDNSSSNPRDFVVWGDFVYFIADDGVHGEELWRTDGTPGGTVMVRDIIDRPIVPISVSQIMPWQGRLLISGDDGSYGHELWMMERADSAPKLVRDMASPAALQVLRSSGGGR